jgi:NitT/TauT family transport system substrate-binding protein
MKHAVIAGALALCLAATTAPAFAEVRTVRMGWCSKTITSAAAPFAIAQKLGWFDKDGIKVELIPLPGSTDCVRLMATKDVQVSLPSVEPLAIIRPQGVKAKFFYTAYQGNIYGIAVPADSPVKTMADLKGKKIGVTSMASGGVKRARARQGRRARSGEGHLDRRRR